MIVRGRPRYEPRMGEVRIKQVQEFKYLERAIIDDGKGDTKIRKHIVIAKDTQPIYTDGSKDGIKMGYEARNNKIKGMKLLCVQRRSGEHRFSS